MTVLRRDDKFRFSLQWAADSEEKLQAGTLLERLGNKKSDFIVVAVTEYLRLHPELAIADAKIQISYQPTPTKAQLQDMVMAMARTAVEELMAGKTVVQVGSGQQAAVPAGPSEQDLEAMIAGLSLFN